MARQLGTINVIGALFRCLQIDSPFYRLSPWLSSRTGSIFAHPIIAEVLKG